ncbi:hypothetical protein IAI18_07775 [Acetobacteraceae bacterium H6797]|nr:hypothetical protein [Acetobacteraceae bacterium H6797]
MSMIRTLAAAALIAGGALVSNGAFARDLGERSYPITTGHAETAVVDYGPDALRHNVLGGGVVADQKQLNGDTKAVYGANAQSQAPRQNLVPVTVGSGESAEIIWVPADQAPSAAAGGTAPVGAING